MSLPQDLSLGEDNMLNFRFAPELKKLRSDDSFHWNASSAGKAPPPGTSLPGIRSRFLEVNVTFMAADKRSVQQLVTTDDSGLKLTDAGGTVYVGFDAAARELYVERTFLAAVATPKRISVPHELAPGESLQLHLLLDACVLEVIANGRSQTQAQVLPSEQAGFGVALVGSHATSVDAWLLHGGGD